MKYDGVIIMMAVANVAMFAAGAALVLHAWMQVGRRRRMSGSKPRLKLCLWIQ